MRQRTKHKSLPLLSSPEASKEASCQGLLELISRSSDHSILCRDKGPPSRALPHQNLSSKIEMAEIKEKYNNNIIIIFSSKRMFSN